jgi:hypothetical protein
MVGDHEFDLIPDLQRLKHSIKSFPYVQEKVRESGFVY